ncbi:MAG TPA: hypothetical protein VLG50_03565 [Candidatus Saccharimonadales bacterium]|nr:hypothetical protein [Candidatus Saccharimonadales bacterium]
MQYHNFIIQHHAHIWVSDQQTLYEQLISQLQKTLCPHQGCTSCNICLQIEQKQHPWVTWIEPEGSYTLENIDHVLESTRFTLDQHEKRFFIFTNAQELTPACSNRLLKTIEEPHKGYFFIFMTSQSEDILPTLASRCFLKQFAQQTISHGYQEIMEPFINASFQNPVGFMKNIDRLAIKESETRDIIDLLLQHFHDQLLKAHGQVQYNPATMLHITDKIILIKHALTQLPISGSSKLFWKNMYMAFHQQSLCLKK